jgi:nucleoside-diphosphate-sugar epimerase
MPVAAAATAFITGADGFVGRALIKVLRSLDHQVFALARCSDAAQRLSSAGATPVIGDLLESGGWQDEAAADWVFHLPSSPRCNSRVNFARVKSLARMGVATDVLLLDALTPCAVRRIVYVADACCYGPTGPRPITEDTPPRPSRCGRCLMPALDRLDGYLVSGLPIVTALPGLVYGNGGWFRRQVIKPIITGQRLIQFGNADRWVSPIHVDDCARALVHLAEHGHTGRRYFLVNRDPVRMPEFAATFARLVNRPMRVWRVPAAASRLMVGPVLADYLRADQIFSNIRLRGTGFHFEHPTLEHGLQQIVGALHE